MASGVAINSECTTAFQKMAEGKKEYRYIIFNINEGKEVVVEKAIRNDEMPTADKDDYEDNSAAAYEVFVKELKELTNGFMDCRYAVFDFKFSGVRDGAGASKIDKIIFLQICPDNSGVKKKMIYASSASAVKAALGTGKIIPLQISDESEMSHAELLKNLSSKFSDRH